jgi:hypothetical protein
LKALAQPSSNLIHALSTEVAMNQWMMNQWSVNE